MVEAKARSTWKSASPSSRNSARQIAAISISSKPLCDGPGVPLSQPSLGAWQRLCSGLFRTVSQVGKATEIWRDDARKAPQWAALFAVVVIGFAIVFGQNAGWFQRGAPLDAEVDVWSMDGETVTFVAYGRKLTDHSLIAMTAAWVFSDDTVLPTAIYRADGDALRVGQTVLEAGDRFLTEPLTAEIDAAALGDDGVRFRVCWAYEAMPTYCISTPFSAINFVQEPVTPSIPRPSAMVRQNQAASLH